MTDDRTARPRTVLRLPALLRVLRRGRRAASTAPAGLEPLNDHLLRDIGLGRGYPGSGRRSLWP